VNGHTLSALQDISTKEKGEPRETWWRIIAIFLLAGTGVVAFLFIPQGSYMQIADQVEIENGDE
jgi:hypothetical protein